MGSKANSFSPPRPPQRPVQSLSLNSFFPGPSSPLAPSVFRFLSSRSISIPKPPPPIVYAEEDSASATSEMTENKNANEADKKLPGGKSGSFATRGDDKHAVQAASNSIGCEVIQESEKEEKEDNEGSSSEQVPDKDSEVELDFETNFRRMEPEIDRFMESLSAARDCNIPPDIPDSFDKFAGLLDEETAKYDSGKDPGKWYRAESGESPFLEAVEKASRLAEELARFRYESKYRATIDRTTNVVQRAMAFLEEEFRSLLEDSRSIGEFEQSDASATTASSRTKKQASFGANQEPNRCILPEPGSAYPSYPTDTVSKLAKIAGAMISAGYDSECCQVYSIVRRNTLEEGLSRIGLEKISIDEVQKMVWESLEGAIVAWIKACNRCIAVCFPGEQRLCGEVFEGQREISGGLLSGLCRGVVIQLLNFAEAVALTKKSAEKLFKFLDMYEGLRDLILLLDELFPASAELKSETAMTRCRLGEAAVAIFSDLENSIKADNGKTTVPGGAVHPLTRYVMNYLKYACEYKDTMEQIFREHRNGEEDPAAVDTTERQSSREAEPPSPFAAQLTAVMDLLDANLETKSKLYRDLPQSYIFLMNNGRYIMQKIKGSAEVHALLGDTRKRSSELRQYHKNYTRETWSKVLSCLRDEGLMQGKGSVNKPVLKERFKSFNALFDEIHKTQSAWIVSDEQLQSELRVSIGAVVVPAYRSFLGRFSQYLDSGRQTEKYIKFGPEELETYIDELFDGTQASMVRRR